MPDELMPNSMIVKFKDNKILMEITSPIGNNGIFNIINPKENQIKTYMRVLTMKYYYQGSTDEVPPGIDPMSDMVILHTDQSSVILGLQCKHATATLPESGFTYDIWYTNEIKLANPNNSTPFKEIDGVLISFFYRMGEMIIEFEADGIFERPVSDKAFELSDNSFRRVNRESMDDLISTMMSL